MCVRYGVLGLCSLPAAGSAGVARLSATGSASWGTSLSAPTSTRHRSGPATSTSARLECALCSTTILHIL